MGRRPTGVTRFTAENTKGAAKKLENLQAIRTTLLRSCAESTAKDRERVFKAWNQ